MSDWIILSTALAGFDHAATKHKVLATRDYLARPQMFRGARNQSNSSLPKRSSRGSAQVPKNTG